MPLDYYNDYNDDSDDYFISFELDIKGTINDSIPYIIREKVKNTSAWIIA